MIYCMLGNLGNVCKCETNYNKMAACEIENTATYMYCFIIGHDELNISCTFQNTLITVKWHVTCLPAFRNCISGIFLDWHFLGYSALIVFVYWGKYIPDVSYK